VNPLGLLKNLFGFIFQFTTIIIMKPAN